jgi:hypothetical protein
MTLVQILELLFWGAGALLALGVTMLGTLAHSLRRR